jgi:hypothetical protein
MSERLEDQIRSYTEALYATAKPVELLTPTGLRESPGIETSPIQVTLEPLRSTSPRRPFLGPAIGLATAVAVLLAAIPLWLLVQNDEPAATDNTQPTATTLSAPTELFIGAWTGEDPKDGSQNTLIVEDGTAIYQETGITACKAQFGQFVGGSASGPATIDGNTLTFTGTLYCNLEEGRTIHPSFEKADWIFDYNPITGGLTLATDANTTLTRTGD